MPKKPHSNPRTGIVLASTVCAVLFLAACGETSEQKGAEEVVFCAADVKICPDGSAVSRVPPSCEFASCSTNISKMPSQKISVSEIPADDCDQDSENQLRCARTGDAVAKISTNHGEIWLRLFVDDTPKTIENFVGLAERGFYDGLIFHRVIPNFMIQGGDPLGTGTGGKSIWGGPFVDEFVANLSNIRGSIAMANRGPNTNTSQFFINQADNSSLDFKHTVFGQIVSGMKIVDAIAGVEKNSTDKPLEDVKMEVTVFEVVEVAGDSAK